MLLKTARGAGDHRRPFAGTRRHVRILRGLSWLFDASLVSAALVLSPIAAVVAFATGHAHGGWIAVAVLVGALVYAPLLAWEAFRRWGRLSRDGEEHG